MRWRLIAVLVGFTAIVLLVQNVPLAQYLRTVEYDRIVTGLQRDAFAIAGLSVESLEVEKGALTDAELGAVVDQYAASTGAVVVIVDSNSIVIAASDDSVGESYANRPEIQSALGEGRAVSGQRDSQTLGEPLLFVAVPVRTSTQSSLGAVRLSYPVSAIDEVVNGRVRGLFVAAAITLLAAAIIAALVAAAVTRRIRRLRDAAEDIADGDLAARADVAGERRDRRARRLVQHHGRPRAARRGVAARLRGRRLAPAPHPARDPPAPSRSRGRGHGRGRPRRRPGGRRPRRDRPAAAAGRRPAHARPRRRP